jgi:hypothetical protein
VDEGVGLRGAVGNGFAADVYHAGLASGVVVGEFGHGECLYVSTARKRDSSLRGLRLE